VDEPKQRSETFSKQSIGMMMGGIAGAALAIRMIFADYDRYVGTGQFPWVTGLGMTLGGCIVGLILATLFTAEMPEPSKETPPAPAAPDGPHEPAPPKSADPHVKPADHVEGIYRGDGPRSPTDPDV
jgi:hypothetical protein